jgi:peptide/nickel transport system ATP-binding protein/oligopeptide transport system ATP-binding protein
MSTPLLEVRDLRVDIDTPRGTLHAVRGASFSVLPGEALGLVGESGCGKSMSLRAILGLLPPKARIVGGEVLLDGVDLVGMGRQELRKVRGRRVSMVFQEPMTALNPVMRVGDQIGEAPAVVLGLDRHRAAERVLELMRLVGIPDPQRRREAYPHELSGGMRQRVMIAIALSCDPELILCDEPTTALDVTIQSQILGLLRELQQSQRLGIVFVTHDLAVIAETCRDVAVMYAGQILETGGVESVFSAPRHPYTLQLLRSVPDVDRPEESLASIPGSPPDLVQPPPGCPFHLRCPFTQDDCRSGDFPLRPVFPGRKTACIHPEECERSLAEGPVIVGA